MKYYILAKFQPKNCLPACGGIRPLADFGERSPLRAGLKHPPSRLGGTPCLAGRQGLSFRDPPFHKGDFPISPPEQRWLGGCLSCLGGPPARRTSGPILLQSEASEPRPFGLDKLSTLYLFTLIG